MSHDLPRQSRPAPGPDWDAIARFLAGESPADEAASVREWLDAHPVDRELVERLDGIVAIDAVADLDVDAALDRMHQRMAQADAAPTLKVQRGIRPQPAAPRWPLVGGIGLAAAAALAYLLFGRAPKQDPSVPRTARTYRTNIGQRDSIQLADGSRVILGPDSRLVVPGTYAAARTVELQGDGYFDVHHDAAKPFSVTVGHAVIEDVGTTFTVESDGRDTTTVSVITGSVRLRANGSPATGGALLAAGDRGSMTVDGHVTTYPHSVASDDTAWTTGRLVFHDASLTRVAAEIHRWYGVNLRIADTSLLEHHFTNSFNGEPVDQVLKVVALAFGGRIVRQGDSATMYVR